MSNNSESKTAATCDNDGDVGVTTAVWTPDDERRLVRKIDLRIFPAIIVLFVLNFIDRNNFANARLKFVPPHTQASNHSHTSGGCLVPR